VSATAESALTGLERHARSDPERPFLFFRTPRGTFGWWSFARAFAEASGNGGPRGEGVDSQHAPSELLELVVRAGEDELLRARRLAAAVTQGAAHGEREIWISARALDRAEERLLVLAGTLAGWAIVREPGDALTADLFLWARPTLLSGTEPELVTLLRSAREAAPRRRRERWLARRLDRLSTVLVEPAESSAALAPVEAELAAAGARRGPSAPRVLPFPESGW
jgi:hypothetical protein